MPKIAEIDTASFIAATAGPTPVLVDFWAPWCGPCHAVAPVLEELAEELAGRVRIAKVNVDDEPDLADRFDVRGIPTMILFSDGRELDRKVGALPKSALSAWVAARTPQSAGAASA